MDATHIWSVSLKKLDDAAKQIITGNRKPLDLAVQTLPERALITAYDQVKSNIISVIGIIKPELACEKIQGGYTLLHLACFLGDVEMTRALVGLGFDRLYYEKDHDFSMTPLHMAIKRGRLDVISVLLSACPPESALELDHEGNTPLHLASDQGNLAGARLLIERHPQLCLMKNKDEKIPLHIAVMRGRVDLVSELLRACLDSIKELTSEGRTVFHLAAQCSLPDVFKVLWEEVAKKLDKDYLLDKVDCQGNSLLHYAVFNNQLRIVEICLTDERWTPGYGFAIWVNTKNNEGDTAMDLYNKIPGRNSETHQIGCILYRASQRDQASQHEPTRALETNMEHLAVLAIFIGLALAVICALPSFFPKEGWVATALVFEFKDALYGELPLIFYLMFFTTVLFTTSIVFLIVLLFKLHYRPLMLLGGISTFCVYLLLTHHIMPKFSVRAGSHLISSYYFMWGLVLVFIFNGALLIHLLMLLLSKVASK